MPFEDLTHLTDHPQFKGTFFYTLPTKLLSALEERQATQKIAPDLLKAEYALASVSESAGCVAFRNGSPVSDVYLSIPQPLSYAGTFYERSMRGLGWDADQVREIVKAMEPLRQFRHETTQAYCGWLFTNRTFRQELAQILDAYPALTDPASGGMLPIAPAERRPSSDLVRLELFDTSQLDEFCTRWRLNAVRGPRTVEPLEAHEDSWNPKLDAIRAERRVGRLSFVPDTTRLLPREIHRAQEEVSIRSTAQKASHLTEWTELVDSSNQGKKSIARFARWYRYQHHWCVFFERHSESLYRLRERTFSAFASWLDISDETLHEDHKEIKRRLGAENAFP